MSFWDQFTQIELCCVEAFRAELDKISDATFASEDTRPPLNLIASGAGFQLRDYPKDGILQQAVWVLYLTKLRKLINENELRYPKFDSFHAAYQHLIATTDITDRAQWHLLWHTANWMKVLFTMIPAYKNKGLAIMVVPKLIEGWDAKYITGSGQKEVTKNRVIIYETEGDTKPNYRGTIKHKKPASKKSPRGTPRGGNRRTYKKVTVSTTSRAATGERVLNKTSETLQPVLNTRRGVSTNSTNDIHIHDLGLTDDENESTVTVETGPYPPVGPYPYQYAQSGTSKSIPQLLMLPPTPTGRTTRSSTRDFLLSTALDPSIQNNADYGYETNGCSINAYNGIYTFASIGNFDSGSNDLERGEQTPGDDLFDEALNLFRDSTSTKLGLSRANSLALPQSLNNCSNSISSNCSYASFNNGAASSNGTGVGLDSVTKSEIIDFSNIVPLSRGNSVGNTIEAMGLGVGMNIVQDDSDIFFASLGPMEV